MNDNRHAEAIDRIVSTAMKTQAIPGLAILVAKDRRIIFASGYGLRDLGDELPVDTRTNFSIASISKQFTAAAVMLFCERGQLSLDDRIERHLPWFRYAPDATIAHLMTHTSGIAGYTEAGDFDLHCVSAATPQEIVQTVIDRAPAFAPGNDWQYSNTNYVILGAILETVAQRSLADIIEDSFLRPLDISATTRSNGASGDSNAALGFASDWLGPWGRAQQWHPSWEFATAGLRSNVLDLFVWNVAQRSGRVVSEKSYREMTTDAKLNDGESVGYGFGLQIGQTSIGRVIGHSGGLPGFSLDNTMFPDREIDIIVLANGESTLTQHSITRRIAAVLSDDTGADFVGLNPPGAFGRPILQPENALTLIDTFVAGRLDGNSITERFDRFLTPARRELVRAISSRGPVRALHPLESYRRDPVTTFAYRAEIYDGTVRAELTLRDDGRVDAIGISRWDGR